MNSNVIRSRIFRLSASDFKPGMCSVCGESALIKFKDASTGANLGECCLEAAIQSERLLSSMQDLRDHDGMPSGLRHPTPEESTKLALHD